jgi:hypothetical protein
LIKEKHVAQGREKTKTNLARLSEMAPLAWITSNLNKIDRKVLGKKNKEDTCCRQHKRLLDSRQVASSS